MSTLLLYIRSSFTTYKYIYNCSFRYSFHCVTQQNYAKFITIMDRKALQPNRIMYVIVLNFFFGVWKTWIMWACMAYLISTPSFHFHFTKSIFSYGTHAWDFSTSSHVQSCSSKKKNDCVSYWFFLNLFRFEEMDFKNFHQNSYFINQYWMEINPLSEINEILNQQPKRKNSLKLKANVPKSCSSDRCVIHSCWVDVQFTPLQ